MTVPAQTHPAQTPQADAPLRSARELRTYFGDPRAGTGVMATT